MSAWDAIVIGAGHNGLTNAAYLAKAGLNVLVVEKNDYIGGAAVSRELQPGWTYSNCSYVCSLLRPEVYRALDLAKYGLQVVPYGGSVTPDPERRLPGEFRRPRPDPPRIRAAQPSRCRRRSSVLAGHHAPVPVHPPVPAADRT